MDAARPGGRGGRHPAGRRPGDRRPAGRRRIRPSDRRTRSSSGASSSPDVAWRPRPARRGLDDLSVPSASCRTIVYKGLVAGGRLAELYPGPRPADPALVRPLPPALRDQHPADLAARPAVPLDRPQRRDRHGPRQSRAGPRAGRRRDRRARQPGRVPSPRRLVEAGPLLSPEGSDSQSLDEMLELLVATGWDLGSALLAAMPEASSLRRAPHPHVATLRRGTAGLLAPWDGPAAIVFSDGRRVGAIMDRNGLRPAAFAVTRDRLVAVASEAGAIPLAPSDTVRRGRLGPGEMLLVDPRRRAVLEDADAKAHLLRRLPIHDAPRPAHVDVDARRPRPDTRRRSAISPVSTPRRPASTSRRWSSRATSRSGAWATTRRRPASPASIGRSPTTSASRSPRSRTRRSIPSASGRSWTCESTSAGARPCSAARRGRRGARGRSASTGRSSPISTRSSMRSRARSAGSTRPGIRRPAPAGLEAALERLAAAAVRGRPRSARSCSSCPIARFSPTRLPIPSVLAVGAVNTALTDAGLRGRSDLLVDAADILDVHSLAMALAVGRDGRRSVARRGAGDRDRGLARRGGADRRRRRRRTSSRRSRPASARRSPGWGSARSPRTSAGCCSRRSSSTPSCSGRCFPGAPAWRGTVGLREIGERGIRRASTAASIAADAPSNQLPDPGFARFKADGEAHLFSPKIAGEIEALGRGTGSGGDRRQPSTDTGSRSRSCERAHPPRRRSSATASAFDGAPASAVPIALADVESARDIVRRFVVSAMSVGALSPEAHQALTIGIQRAGGAANTGEGGEDPAWYIADRDAASGTTPGSSRSRRPGSASPRQYLARADQLEIKIAQGSKPGEGGQLPARKATAYIAALRRGQPGMTYISPPPHHDIYSIEDLAQLIADLRAINPAARVGVKLVASRGVGTIAAGVVKAGASYVHLAGHAGGTGASPLSSIKHVGAPWELGLAEVHQTLLRNGLRDRVALRTDGGLRTGRDLLVAALLGAEEFAFGTSMLVAIGCDMARQCHLDTCPTGIATQREDLRAKFTGHARARSSDSRSPLPRISAASSPPSAPGRSARSSVREPRLLAPARGRRVRNARSCAGRSVRRTGMPPRPAARTRPGPAAMSSASRRPRSRRISSPRSAARAVSRPADSSSRRPIARSGRRLSGALERGQLRGPDPARAPRRRRPVIRRVRRAGSRPPARRPGERLRRQGPVGRPARVAPEPELAADAEPPGDRRQHLPLRRDRRPAPPRRAGGNAVRRSQLRAQSPSSRGSASTAAST